MTLEEQIALLESLRDIGSAEEQRETCEMLMGELVRVPVSSTYRCVEGTGSPYIRLMIRT